MQILSFLISSPNALPFHKKLVSWWWCPGPRGCAALVMLVFPGCPGQGALGPCPAMAAAHQDLLRKSGLGPQEGQIFPGMLLCEVGWSPGLEFSVPCSCALCPVSCLKCQVIGFSVVKPKASQLYKPLVVLWMSLVWAVMAPGSPGSLSSLTGRVQDTALAQPVALALLWLPGWAQVPLQGGESGTWEEAGEYKPGWG